MSLKLGNVDVSKVMLGSSGVSVVYKGADEVWRVGGSSGGYGDDVFSTYLYEGNGGTQTIENGIDLANEGGLVWVKNRTSGKVSDPHVLTDTEMPKGGSGSYNFLSSNTADGLNPANQGNITNFNENGFTAFGNYDWNNKPGQDYVSWTFRNAPKFFSCVTYTGTGVDRDIPHNLGIEPGMVIVKRTDSTSDWYVWHKNGGDYASIVNARGQFNETDPFRAGTEFQDSLMTDSAFGLGSSNGSNSSGGEYVAYLFANDESDGSMIKCGGYVGNGNTDGPEIDLGFEPQWVMIKSATGSHGWIMHDTMRGWTADGKPIARLRADTASEEYTDNNYTEVAVTPTGFRMTDTHASTNGSGDEYIYMAIRRPNKPAEEFDPEELFATSIGQSDDPSFVGGFPVDMGIHTKPGSAGFNRSVVTRMTEKTLYTEVNAAELVAENGFDYMDGYIKNQYMDASWQSWMWRRAPGYFDVVCYEGDGQVREVPHNLGVAPEMMWVKKRSNSANWFVYSKAIGATEYLLLNEAQPENTWQGYWNDTDPTSEHFTIGPDVSKAGEDYIAYLFASVPGISKVGSYTGNGGSQDIDCGFTHGAKCLLVKRTDGTGDWVWHWPSNSGDALKYTIKLNSTDKFASQYAVLAIPSGFSASGDICNIDGAEYIFYAIAAPSIGALLKKYAKGISNDS